jgi:FtsZ-binding cell division protein ZapB
MKNPIESVHHFCVIQLEILKTREHKLRKEMQDCQIQREFLSQVLQDIGEVDQFEGDIIGNLLDTIRSRKK